eukprot:CAMPEP_0194290032 /NCGR_PEP_ID=MMETSP0169-20130528/40426_1 /TAXON_ID=218684 /ORGANISM="Corethron pennatum, Strain L29A3" /LENGTH=1109 /DNA_ID=CAMNT_0039037509 /DNA_START=160 /DNA_END=3489 /DNA_ORIENTATION=-
MVVKNHLTSKRRLSLQHQQQYQQQHHQQQHVAQSDDSPGNSEHAPPDSTLHPRGPPSLSMTPPQISRARRTGAKRGVGKFLGAHIGAAISVRRQSSTTDHDYIDCDAQPSLQLPPLPAIAPMQMSPRESHHVPQQQVRSRPVDLDTGDHWDHQPSDCLNRRRPLISRSHSADECTSPELLGGAAPLIQSPLPWGSSSAHPYGANGDDALLLRLSSIYPEEGATTMEGTLLKRTHLNGTAAGLAGRLWNERHFVLRNSALLWYVRLSDREPKGRLELLPGCTSVSEIETKIETKPKTVNKKKKLHMIKISTFLSREAMEEYHREEGDDMIPSHQAGVASSGEMQLSPPRTDTAIAPLHTPEASPTLDSHLSKPFSESFDEEDTGDHGAGGGETVPSSRNIVKKNDKKKKYQKALVYGSQAAGIAGGLTAGTIAIFGTGGGIIPLLLMTSVGVGGTGTIASVFSNHRKKARMDSAIIASERYDVIAGWRDAIIASIVEKGDGSKTDTTRQSQVMAETDPALDSTWARLFKNDGRVLDSGLEELPTVVSEKIVSKLDSVETYLQSSQWRLLEGGWANTLGTGTNGMRIFEEDKGFGTAMVVRRRRVSVEGRPCPPLRASVILNATPEDAFMCLMSYTNSKVIENFQSNQKCRHAFEIVERLDNHSDLIRLEYEPLYLFPSWTAPRDFCLMRYWRQDDDGSYIVCMDSITHRECPLRPTHIRGDLHGVYTITPRKGPRSNATQECLLTCIVQVDPKGWIPTFSLSSNQSYADAYSVAALLHLLDIRDVLDHDRFCPVGCDPHDPQSLFDENYSIDSKESLDYSTHSQVLPSANVNYVTFENDKDPGATVALHPPPLGKIYWTEPDANKFKVRGKQYKTDKKKIKAGKSAFRLLAVDIVEVAAPLMGGLCNHPKERVQQAIEREKMGIAQKGDLAPFVFAVNIIMPGSKYYHFVMYYAVDTMSTIDGTDGTPFSKLANEFFFGDSDEMRDNTFKLIPHIIDGNFIVRKAVGSTPAIMGRKLKQHYVKSDRFFELICDVGSSSIASGVVGLVLGYAKTLIVDLGFILEGNDESTLPERIMGSAQCKYVDFLKGFRFVEAYDDNDSLPSISVANDT